MVSVALCTYNGEKYIKEQLDSILNQTIKVSEIIICDDKSSDRTIEILNKYKEKYPDIIKIYINSDNLKSIKNFEKAIMLCNCDYIFLSDQDDIWEPNKVDVVLAEFKKDRTINCIATNAYIINEESIINDKVLTIWDVPKLLKDSNVDLNYFNILSCYNNFVTGATLAIKKQFVDELVPFPNNDKIMHHDEWIALKSSFTKSLVFIDNKLIRYRVHSNQQVGGVIYKNTKKKRDFFINVFGNKPISNPVYYKRKLKIMTRNYNKICNLEKEFQDEILKHVKDVIKNNLKITELKFEDNFRFYYKSYLFIQKLKSKYK